MKIDIYDIDINPVFTNAGETVANIYTFKVDARNSTMKCELSVSPTPEEIALLEQVQESVRKRVAAMFVQEV